MSQKAVASSFTLDYSEAMVCFTLINPKVIYILCFDFVIKIKQKYLNYEIYYSIEKQSASA